MGSYTNENEFCHELRNLIKLHKTAVVGAQSLPLMEWAFVMSPRLGRAGVEGRFPPLHPRLCLTSITGHAKQEGMWVLMLLLHSLCLVQMEWWAQCCCPKKSGEKGGRAIGWSMHLTQAFRVPYAVGPPRKAAKISLGSVCWRSRTRFKAGGRDRLGKLS